MSNQLSAETVLDRLRAAKAEHDRQRQLVIDEMNERGSQGQLWRNDKCKAWPDYERALTNLNLVRKECGV